MSHTIRKTRRAFSLPEVILSIFVLLAGILPVFGALNGGMADSLKSQELVIASELAQEGTELVQNVRDNSFASNGTGFETFTASINCRLDYIDSTNNGNNKNVFTDPKGEIHNSKIDCAGGGQNRFDLTLNGAGFYSHSDAAGKFKREIFLVEVTSGVKWMAYSVVYWGSTGPTTVAELTSLPCNAFNKCIYAQTELSKWSGI
jgi:Tfp pilus assembly protein PilV